MQSYPQLSDDLIISQICLNFKTLKELIFLNTKKFDFLNVNFLIDLFDDEICYKANDVYDVPYYIKNNVSGGIDTLRDSLKDVIKTLFRLLLKVNDKVLMDLDENGRLKNSWFKKEIGIYDVQYLYFIIDDTFSNKKIKKKFPNHEFYDDSYKKRLESFMKDNDIIMRTNLLDAYSCWENQHWGWDLDVVSNSKLPPNSMIGNLILLNIQTKLMESAIYLKKLKHFFTTDDSHYPNFLLNAEWMKHVFTTEFGKTVLKRFNNSLSLLISTIIDQIEFELETHKMNDQNFYEICNKLVNGVFADHDPDELKKLYEIIKNFKKSKLHIKKKRKLNEEDMDTVSSPINTKSKKKRKSSQHNNIINNTQT